MIAYDVQFTEPSEDPERRRRADRGGRARAARSCSATDRGRAGRRDRRSSAAAKALEYSGATPAQRTVRDDADGTRPADAVRSSNGLETSPIAAARLQARARGALPPASARVDRLPGPAGTVRPAELRRRRARARSTRAAVRGKVVVVGATAPRARGPPRHVDERRRCRGPEVQAAAIATALAGFPLRRRARLARRAARDPGAGARRAAGRAALRRVAAVLAGLLAVALFLVVAQLAFNGGTILAGGAAAGRGARRRRADAVARRNPSRVPLDRAAGPARPAARRQPAHARGCGALLLLGAAFFVVAVTLVLQAHATRCSALELCDRRQALRRPRQPGPPPDDVVVVAHRRHDVHQPPKPRWPFERATAREGRSATCRRPGAKVIAYDVQFTEPERRRRRPTTRLIEAVARRPATSSWRRPRSTAGGTTRDLRRRRGARATAEAMPAITGYSTTTPTAAIRRMPFADPGARGVRRSPPPRLARGRRHRAPPGDTRLDRLRRAAGDTFDVPQLRRRRRRARSTRPTSRQDRRRRRHGAVAAGPAPDLDDRATS